MRRDDLGIGRWASEGRRQPGPFHHYSSPGAGQRRRQQFRGVVVIADQLPQQAHFFPGQRCFPPVRVHGIEIHDFGPLIFTQPPQVFPPIRLAKTQTLPDPRANLWILRSALQSIAQQGGDDG